MSNSISKLIVAGMTLALSLTSVNAQEAVKVTKTNGIGGAANIEARASHKKAAIKPLFRTSKTNQMSQVSNVSAPKILQGKKAPMRVSGAETNLYGSVIYSDDPSFATGIYSIPTNGSTEVIEALTNIRESVATGGAYYADGRYYVSQLDTFWGMIFGIYHFIIDLDSFDVEEVDNFDLSTVAIDQDYDPVTGMVYGCYYNEEGSGYIFGSQEVGTFVTKKIADSQMYNGIAISKEGIVYGITTNGDLYTIDKETGAPTLVGSTGAATAYLTSATMDQKTGVLYWTTNDDYAAKLFTVDTATAEATLIAELDDNPEIAGLYVPGPLAEDDAPAAIDAETFSIGNPNGEAGAITTRTAEISFVLPSKTFAGGSLYPSVSYKILRNGKEITSGTQNIGTIVKYLDVVPRSGEYTYTVYAVNEEGNGPKVKNTVFIGTDTPAAPKNVNTTFADNTFTITWDAVDAGMFGGALSSDVTYTVCGYKNGAQFMVQNDIAGTSYQVAIAEPASISSYFFTVEANTSTTSSEVAASTSTALGSARAPFTVDFEDPNDLALFTVIDANGDGRTWEVSSGTASVGYNGSLDMDDWLITPPIMLKAGYLYEFYFSAKAGSDYYVPETVEAAMGTAATVDAMTTILVEPTDLTSMEFKKFRVSVKPETDGSYYFGIHGISPADMLRLHIDDLGISAGLTSAAPAAATDLKLDPATDGSLKATISYNAPATTLAGDPTSLMFVELYRNDELIDTNNGVKAGAAVTYEDEVPVAGEYTYTVIAYNTSNGGDKASVSGYVGINIPAAPAAATVARTAKDGEVLISWDATTEDKDGNPINPDFVSYLVVDVATMDIVAQVKETSVTYQAVPAGEQDFVYYGVFAATDAGVSATAAVTDMIPVGTPFELPYAESFNDGYLSYPMAVMGGNGEWQVTDGSSLDMTDADGTNGFVTYGCQSAGDQSALISGLITLNAEAPALSFACYGIAENDENTIDVMVLTADSTEPVLVETVPQNGLGWMYKTVNLTEYAGQTVQIYFVVTVNAYVYTMFDDIRIQNLAEYDLVAQSINAPAVVEPGEEFNVEVSVMNMGAKTAETYSVELLRNGEVVASVAGEAVESFKTAVVAIPQTLGVVDPESNVYSAKVVFDLDENADNNITGDYAVALEQFNAPIAEDVKAVYSTTGVELTWNAPDMSKAPVKTTTDDFESYAPFATGGVGEWTLVDVDGGAIGGVQGVQFGDIVPGEAEAAYFVMNTELGGVSESAAYIAHSGVQYMVSTFLYSGNAYVDDWMITPELSGTKQTISFYAKSFNTSYPESFKVLYSTTDPVTEEFVEIATESNISGEWTKYSYTVPEGAKYFAINCVSYDAFMFFVDDVTYGAAGAEPIDLTLVGYNIYKNGVKLNEAPVTETSYVDAEGSADDLYQISVVYEEGESAATAAVKAETALIGKVEFGKANVKVEARSIVVTGAEGNVNVYTADGKMVYNAAGESRNVINVAPGIYVVKTGKLVEKVIVK